MAGSCWPADSAGQIAWIRFDDSPAEYQGTPYRFLGAGEIALTLDAPLEAGGRIDLLWGAKKDMRVASLEIGGRSIALNHGGYDGFQWFSVPVPPDIPPATRTLCLRATGAGKAAFIAEARVAPASASDVLSGKMTAKSRGIRLTEAPSIEAFPEMRAMWDNAKKTSGTEPFASAERNARLAAEGFYRCRRYVDGWLAHADPATGLIPRNLTASRDLWNGRDSAADNYPFMVLTCALTDRAMFGGRMRQMLDTETRLTSRLGRLGDHYSFSKKGFVHETVDIDRLVFDNAEYVKDGLIPIAELLGRSPWSDRMIGLVDDIWANASIETPFGRIPTLNFEVNGDLLQACSRLFWFCGERKYLEWATRLGDYYLLGKNHPTRDTEDLRLSDHSCEVINGLSELYVAVAHAAPEKRDAYRAPLHEMYDRIMAIGLNEHGLIHGRVNTKTGTQSGGITDNWGYNYDGVYTAFLLDGTAEYRDAVRKALGNLKAHYTGFQWQGGSADGYADSIEGAITLYNREPIASTAEWIDSEMKVMWAKQKADGVIEGWHGDGNFARTTLMYCLWKTQGIHVEPWRDDLRVGSIREGEGVAISISADRAWQGRVIFDRARHRSNMRLPIDYPRINQFPEWFVVEAGKPYLILEEGSGQERAVNGQGLLEGLTIKLEPGAEMRWRVRPQ